MSTAEALAATHHACFAADRSWSAEEIAALLDDASVILCGDASSFVLGRVIFDEAEVLTVATHPDARRLGLAAGCLAGFHAQARRTGAARAFLEVAEDNIGARALYARFGYAQVGLRQGYYVRSGGRRVDALVLSLDLNA